jgi:AraC family transcriptional regulator
MVIRAPNAPSTFVLSETARYHHWSGAGALSVKSFFGGPVFYESHGPFVLDQRAYLILNHDQPYTIHIDSPTPIESFCVFFAPGLAEETLTAAQALPETLLDDPQRTVSTPVQFYDRTYPHDAVLSPALLQLRAALKLGPLDPGQLTEQFYSLMECLLQAHRLTLAQVAALPALKAATREELYRRLYRARDFAQASLSQPLTLETLAQVACLSPSHFLRTFKQAFHQTPHQFLTDQRLRHAQHLLRHTTQPITDISLAVGFESLGSFSWLFKRRLGLSPLAYRSLMSGKNDDFGEAPARPLI